MLSRVERTASWLMLDLPPETLRSSRGMCQIVSSSSGYMERERRRSAVLEGQASEEVHSGVSGREEAVLLELESLGRLLDRNDGESNLSTHMRKSAQAPFVPTARAVRTLLVQLYIIGAISLPEALEMPSHKSLVRALPYK